MWNLGFFFPSPNLFGRVMAFKEVRSVKNSGMNLSFVAAFIKANCPNLATFHEEIKGVERAATVPFPDLTHLSEEIHQVVESLNNIRTQLDSCLEENS